VAPPLATLPNTQSSSIQIEFTLRGGPLAASEAREHVAAANGVVPRSVRAEALLLLTELVTNAVRHGGASDGLPVEVAVTRSPRGVRIVVRDPGAGFEWRGRETTSVREESGYGLLLVDRMASRWGIVRGESATTVWFELSAG
jgi:anti-sigma regulatory factor (Ser/Thr protein kinase)